MLGVDSAPEVGAPDILADVEHILAAPELPDTEKAQLVQARRGQGVFRSRVSLLEAGCRLTGVTDRAHLRASHIKPWKDSTNAERLDGNNGLLLAPHIDHLFDRGFISFDSAGRLLVSARLKVEVLKAWGITSSHGPSLFTAEQHGYLSHHRNRVFLDNVD